LEYGQSNCILPKSPKSQQIARELSRIVAAGTHIGYQGKHWIFMIFLRPNHLNGKGY